MTDAEEKIIQAAADCIEEFGIKNATIRRISEKAGMNSASISYYFRGKDALIDHVMNATLDDAFSWKEFAYTEELPLEEQLFEIFYFFAKNTLKYPNLSHAHFYEITANRNYNSKTKTKLNAFLQKVFGEIKRKKPDMADEDIYIALIQITSSTLLFLSTFENLFSDFSSVDIHDTKILQQYVKRIIERLL